MEKISTHVAKTLDQGVHGNLFGGVMLSWLDEAGAAYASEKARSTRMVTVAMGGVVFHNPVKLGRIVKIYGSILKVGTTSITVKLEARAFNTFTGKETLVCATDVTYVRIDDDGSPIPIDKTKLE
jgi:acyl-CoA thioesterase YciA